MLRFEWDEAKASENERKHGVSLEETQTVFGDAYALCVYDELHSIDEHRFIIIGMSLRERLLFVVYAERTELTIRLISARRATLRERRDYEEKDR